MATKQYKTPGVYIQEPNSFPPSIVGVETAVPCFIGYTERASDNDGRSLGLVPRRVESMAEFVQYFGQGYPELYYLAPATGTGAAKTYTVPDDDQDWGAISLDGKNVYHLAEVGRASFNLYNSMRLFYANGGGSCYVISCDTYSDEAGQPKNISATAIGPALEVCKTFIGPTMVVVPDAVLLSEAEYNTIAVQMLKTCAEAQDRMAIIDIQGAVKLAPRGDWLPLVEAFRNTIHTGTSQEEWRYGAAYFPPLVTSIVAADEIDITNFDTSTPARRTALTNALSYVVAANFPADPKPAAVITAPVATTESETSASTETAVTGAAEAPPVPKERDLNDRGQKILKNYINQIGKSQPNDTIFPKLAAGASAPDPQLLTHRQLTQALVATVPAFRQLLAAIAATQGVLPPSGAMAGVWTANDTLRGVWNAPANTGIATMIRPLLSINDKQQEELNVPVDSLAVNAIRTFQGRGSLIWGARTLDSNSNDWRYIQVRRTMIYVEQSVKQALESMVFKPNTAQTWVTVVSMIESFLHGLWAAGGLMGSTPNEAYVVQAGLGSTMTPQDVLEGVMRVHITLQMVHPAEFIELTFKQQMLGGA